MQTDFFIIFVFGVIKCRGRSGNKEGSEVLLA